MNREIRSPDNVEDMITSWVDELIDWGRQYSFWPMFFGLSCCFIEQMVTYTSRYDISRFGAEVLRGTPRQADLLITSGTIFKKIAPVVLRLYEQMPEPKWVMSMGSCSNCGGMYDVYSVVQGIDQILPVDIYIPGCPPRPEAVLQGLTLLQEKVKTEKPTRTIFHLAGGTQGTQKPILKDGISKSREPRGPGYDGTPVRGTAVTPPGFWQSRSERMWTPPAHRIEFDERDKALSRSLTERFQDGVREVPHPSDMPTFQVEESSLKAVLRFLKTESTPRFRRLDDLTAVDESARRHPEDYPDYTLVYHLLSYDTASRVRLKTGLKGRNPTTQSVTDIWPSANWYEREVFDLFGIRFKGHPRLRRILMPPAWEGFPLRKSAKGRATEMAPYTRADAERLQPLDAGAYFTPRGDEEYLLNIGPHHVSTHGLMRFIVLARGEEVRGLDMDIGYHHRGVEKIGERQSWYQFMPYTDRVDYLSGVANNLSYVLSVETLAGIQVPDRAQCIRVMLAEFFRISNHLMWLGELAHDTGAMSPIFYTVTDRERIMDIVEFITGARLHPAWFRLGGVAADLPEGWEDPVRDFLRIFPGRIDAYESLLTHNAIFKGRTRGIGHLSADDAVEWGITGPVLRGSGVNWDVRKHMPYSGYEDFDFDVPYFEEGDCYARYRVRVEEMRQSVRIIEQAIKKMPPGRYITDDYRYAVPKKDETLKDIETLIHHFINVTRGPKIPRGESYLTTESARGEQGYYVVSDGLNMAYRMRIRTPDFAHIQAMPLMAVGGSISDLIPIIGSVDYVMPDTDR
ncbi:MAG: NADH-quinone oxidoreductase subunit B/C/D [Deltaproteobacteria bacterium]